MWAFNFDDRIAVLLEEGFSGDEKFIYREDVALVASSLILETISDAAFLRFVEENK
jgi:hypothetical protein